jgi:hypothetical protein
MSILNIVLWLLGIVLIAIGYREAKGPWDRYQVLKEQDANEARYASWRRRICIATEAPVVESSRRPPRHDA